MGWRPLRRALGALGLFLALIAAFWPRAVPSALATSSISLNPAGGPPGTQVTITVNNPPTINQGDAIEIVYDPGANCGNILTLPLATAGQAGVLPPLLFTVPAPDVAGCPSSYNAQINVLDLTSLILLGQATFQVSGTPIATPTGTPPTGTPTGTVGPNQFVLSPSTAALGQPVSFNAGGFRPGETVTLNLIINTTTVVGLSLVSGSLTADSNGHVSGGFEVPVSPQTIIANGSGGNAGYTGLVTLVGTNSHVQQQASLTIPATSISGSANTATPGGSFNVTGAGFASGETVQVTLIDNVGNATNLGTTIAHADGTIAGPFTAPNTNGAFTLKAQGLTSNMAASQAITVGTPIGIALSPVIVLPSQNVTVTGAGFSHNATITISGLDSGPVNVTSDNNGAFTITLTAPANPSANVLTITATDTNGLKASTYLTIDTGQTAAITVTPTTASPGQTVTVNGSYFAAGEPVTLTFATNAAPPVPVATATVTATVDATRAFSVAVTVPNLTPGSYVLIATGQRSNRAASAALTIGTAATATTTISPTATATATSGYVPFPTSVNTVPPPAPTSTATSAAPPPNVTQITYFAEGYTGTAAVNGRATFFESLHLFNTTTQPAPATVTYYVLGATGTTTQIAKTVNLGPLAATTLSVNGDVGPDKQVSIAVAHTPGLVAQMEIHRRTAAGARLDAAASAGSAQAATTWDFAEGYTGVSFQEYLSIFNPNATAANVQLRFLPTGGAAPAPVSYQVGAFGRRTINIRAAYLGLAGPHAPKSIAILVSGDQRIVVDRVLYWGDGAGSGKFGYEIAPGISAGSTGMIFPALVLGNGNQPYVTVLNPGPARADLQFTFRDSAGNLLAAYTTGVAGLARFTLPVQSVLRSFTGVASATLAATLPVVAEAPLYFGGSPNIGAHPGVAELGAGAAVTAATASFSGGATLYVFNPGTTALQVTEQSGGAGGAGAGTALSVPPHGLAVSGLSAGSGPHGLLLTAGGPFLAAVINGDGRTGAWGGTLLAP